MYKQINLLGVKITEITIEQLHQYIAKQINNHRRSYIPYVNVYGLNLAYTDKKLTDFINQAEVVICDGAGVVYSSRLFGYNIPYRITYADWIWQLANFSTNQGFSFYFLGAAPGRAEKAAKKIQERFPKLNIVGTHHGYFDKTPRSKETENVIETINQHNPDILIIGFGMPLQEYWLAEHYDQIHANVILCGGAVFDYISGELKRAPKWMTDNGLEWLGRLLIEPSRLWKRYIIGNPLFLFRLLKQRILKRNSVLS